MSQFKTKLVVSPCSNCDWELEEPLVFESRLSGEPVLLTAPAGFQTNLASVPRVFRTTFAPYSPEYAAASALHDWLYTDPNMPKRQADRIFLEAMEATDVPEWKRSLMYRAVQWFGHGSRRKALRSRTS